MAKNKNNLTIQQQNFVDKFLETNNASEAYRFAYNCKNMKEKTITNNAYKLLQNNDIATTIKNSQERLQEKTDITKERILKELNAILEAKITDYVEFKGTTLKFKDLELLTEAQQRAIESIEETKFGIKLKLHGKSWTIERICKMLGFDAPTGIDLTTLGDKIDNKIQIEVIDSISKVENKEE